MAAYLIAKRNEGRQVADIARRYTGRKRRRPIRAADWSQARKRQRVYKRRGVKRKREPIAKQLRDIRRKLNATTTTYVWRKRAYDRVESSGNNVSTKASFSGNSLTYVEQAIDSLKYYDPSAPSALVSADFTSGSYNKQVMLSGNSRLLVKNNYTVSCKCTVYVVVPRGDTSITANTAVENGWTDVGLLFTTGVNQYPEDSLQFMQMWKIVKKKKKILKIGQAMTAGFKIREFMYNPALADAHTETFQPRYQAHQYLIRVEGILAHDNSLDQQGLLRGGVDVQIDTTIVAKYDGGADIKFVEIQDDGAQFTGTAQVNVPSISENISYAR